MAPPPPDPPMFTIKAYHLYTESHLQWVKKIHFRVGPTIKLNSNLFRMPNNTYRPICIKNKYRGLRGREGFKDIGFKEKQHHICREYLHCIVHSFFTFKYSLFFTVVLFCFCCGFSYKERSWQRSSTLLTVTAFHSCSGGNLFPGLKQKKTLLNSAIHKTAGFTVPGRSMILPGTIPLFHPWSRQWGWWLEWSLRSFQPLAERWTVALRIAL